MKNSHDIKSPFNNNTVFHLNKIAHVQGNIHPEEYAIIKTSVDKRQKEFIAGRLLVKRSLKVFGIENFALLSGDNREPIWPDNIIGSISHSNKYICTAVSEISSYKGIGVDLEPIGEVRKNMLHHILTENEQNWLKGLEQDNLKKLYTIIFSAKESIYKCIFPIVRKFIDFHQVDTFIDQQNNTIEIININGISGINLKFIRAHYLTFNDHVLTYVTYYAM